MEPEAPAADPGVLNALIAALTHEFRGPLAPLSNGLQILKLRGTEPAAGDILAMMDRQLRLLSGLLDDLQDVNRLAQGRINLQANRLDLARLVRAVSRDLPAGLTPPDLSFALEVPDVPVWIQGDAGRLVRVLRSLLHNAVRFTPVGGKVTLRLRADTAANQAVLSVRDTGAGLEPEALASLFRPFPAASVDPARPRGGLGLGLTLAKGLIDLHGGTLQAASAGRGKGAEFTIRLPLLPEPAPVADQPEALHSPAKRLRILIIEDNADSAESLRMLLSASGYDVSVANTGREGVAAALVQHPDVVLCDIGLPGLDGYGVVGELRRNTATAGARVFALTGYGSDEDRRRSKQAGFDLHLVKPVSPALLEGLLADAERN